MFFLLIIVVYLFGIDEYDLYFRPVNNESTYKILLLNQLL